MTQQPVPPPPAKPRARWLVLSGVWLIYAAFGLVASSVAPLVDEIARELRMSHSAMGGVMGAWQLVFIVAAIPCGRLLDRLGNRYALVLGVLCVAASAVGRGLADAPWQLVCAVMLFGVGGPIISAGAPKVISEWFSGSERGLAMGIYVTGPAIGSITALMLTRAWLLPLLGGDWRAVFFCWAAVAVSAGAI